MDTTATHNIRVIIIIIIMVIYYISVICVFLSVNRTITTSAQRRPRQGYPFFFLKNYLLTTASLSAVFFHRPFVFTFFSPLVFDTPRRYVVCLRATVSDDKTDPTVATNIIIFNRFLIRNLEKSWKGQSPLIIQTRTFGTLLWCEVCEDAAQNVTWYYLKSYETYVHIGNIRIPL